VFHESEAVGSVPLAEREVTEYGSEKALFRGNDVSTFSAAAASRTFVVAKWPVHTISFEVLTSGMCERTASLYAGATQSNIIVLATGIVVLRFLVDLPTHRTSWVRDDRSGLSVFNEERLGILLASADRPFAV